MNDLQSKLERIRLLEREKEIKDNLPHLYGWPWYKWAHEFFDSTARECFLCAANQISKSSTQIRKCIDWATDQKKWKGRFKRRPLVFWYLYPTKEVATIEFEKKWVPEFLPRGSLKDDPYWGWKEEYNGKFIWAIHFNSGVSVYFKTYGTDVQNLQTGTVDAIFCDEELPEDLYDELTQRRSATEGYFSMVFTATLGQEFWREVIEEKGSHERFPDAVKWQISKYDCMFYEDGTPSDWTEERITREKNQCKNDAEIQRRIYGKFVVDEDLKYPSFQPARNVKPYHHIPRDWHVFVGVDMGSGGKKNHPAAIVFTGVSPDFKKGRIFKGWRGDGVETTAADVFRMYQDMRQGINVTCVYYDYSAKDLGLISAANGEPFIPADKAHETGERVLNVLFKNELLAIYDLPELTPLVRELVSLKSSTAKTKAKDDFIDAARYSVVSVAWDWTIIGGKQEVRSLPKQTEEQRRRGELSAEESEAILVNQDFEEWNELYES
jgi:phage terminase large subunit-like protein